MNLVSLKCSSRHIVYMNISWEMALLLGAVNRVWNSLNLGPFVVTSAKDGKHKLRSLHKQYSLEDVPGQAVDIRTRHLFKKGKYDNRIIYLTTLLQEDYGKCGLRIFLHGYHDKGVPHLHLAYDKKKGRLWRWVK